MSTYDLHLYLPILDKATIWSLHLLDCGEIVEPGQDFTEFVLDTSHGRLQIKAISECSCDRSWFVGSDLSHSGPAADCE